MRTAREILREFVQRCHGGADDTEFKDLVEEADAIRPDLTDEKLIEVALCAWCNVPVGFFKPEDLQKYGRAEGWGRVVKRMKEVLL